MQALPETLIKDYKHWSVVFREKQVTIGSVIILSKQIDRISLGDITEEAWGEFGAVCHDVESMIVTAFGAEKFNYLALMMFDPEVHFHVIPRYSQPINFLGQEFIDPDWPSGTKKVAMDLNEETLMAIKTRLLDSFDK